MAEAFLNVLVGNLCSLIQGEIGLIIGVDEEMNNLSSTLTTIQSVLEDAEMKQLQSKAIHNWLVKLSDLAYDIDDILDECATEVSKLEHKNSKFSIYSLKKILFRRKIGRRMKRVTQQLDAVAAERAKFHLREMAVHKPIEVAATRETGSTLNDSHLVYGREEDTEKIVDILVNQVNDNREITILPIIGVGGLGKTTLARLVYNDQRVVDHFDKRIWVCVSDNFDFKNLVRAMIESGDESASDVVHLDTLQRRLWELLNRKRYLIVLDDVWNEDQDKWSELTNVLSCGSTGCSIILTTRLKKVADMMKTYTTHHLMGLSEEHCWMLLRERAFGKEKKVYPNLEAIGKQIVEKCAGVPLAAKALGGLLRFKRTEKEWNYVKESEIWELPQEETPILPALRLSYHHLPSALRPCFAYCAIFPKDSRIEKRELIFLWMAHGYISPEGVLEVEDVGNQICNELVLRSLLHYDSDADNPTLIMHDLVHDLAQSITKNTIHGAQVLRNVKNSSNNKIRQVNLGRKSVAVRSSNQSEMDMRSILMKFCRLRILDASKTGINELSSAVGNLKHLRNLNLSRTEIRSLPDSICSLWNLQVLNLDGCKRLEALPKKTRYLINLRHLFLEDCRSLREMPSKIGELTSLRTLSMFIVGHNRGNRLDELQCLKLGGNLTISDLEKVENPLDARKANLAEKENIRRLYLFWGNDKYSLKSGEEERDEKVLEALEPHPNLEILEIGGFRGRRFPIWMSNSTLDKVVEIYLVKCENCLRLPQLGELPHLKSLFVDNVAGVEYIIEDQVVQSGNPSQSVQNYFPSLGKLHLSSLRNLKGLLKEQVSRSAEAFPNLEELEILCCSAVVLPPLSSLKKLKILSCSSLTLAPLSKVELETLTDLSVDFENTCTMTVETLQSLTNLKKLSISNVDELSLPEQGLRHLTALEELYITSCSELVELPEGIKHLHCLQSLFLCDLQKMVCVPKALKHVSSSLRSIFLYNLPELNSLPDWLDNLTSLYHLSICNCPNLVSLPASIRRMTNLRYLSVDKCPELERRCERAKGEDWHKIAHIPCSEIGEQL